MTLRLNTTVDIETDNAANTVAAIEEALSDTSYRLNVTRDTVRLYARREVDNGSLPEATDAVVKELNALDGVEIEAGDIEVSGRGD
ncbi:hypothetical protein [Halobellus rufus]|uniref:hypothetical protein n=1 Tax=Halobellus rufus TaxID=1448860 RepID=UPI000678C520|nr:hypothetical protein [Halobellus rufus]